MPSRRIAVLLALSLALSPLQPAAASVRGALPVSGAPVQPAALQAALSLRLSELPLFDADPKLDLANLWLAGSAAAQPGLQAERREAARVAVELLANPEAVRALRPELVKALGRGPVRRLERSAANLGRALSRDSALAEMWLRAKGALEVDASPALSAVRLAALFDRSSERADAVRAPLRGLLAAPEQPRRAAPPVRVRPGATRPLRAKSDAELELDVHEYRRDARGYLAAAAGFGAAAAWLFFSESPLAVGLASIPAIVSALALAAAGEAALEGRRARRSLSRSSGLKAEGDGRLPYRGDTPEAARSRAEAELREEVEFSAKSVRGFLWLTAGLAAATAFVAFSDNPLALGFASLTGIPALLSLGAAGEAALEGRRARRALSRTAPRRGLHAESDEGPKPRALLPSSPASPMSDPARRPAVLRSLSRGGVEPDAERVGKLAKTVAEDATAMKFMIGMSAYFSALGALLYLNGNPMSLGFAGMFGIIGLVSSLAVGETALSRRRSQRELETYLDGFRDEAELRERRLAGLESAEDRAQLAFLFLGLGSIMLTGYGFLGWLLAGLNGALYLWIPAVLSLLGAVPAALRWTRAEKELDSFKREKHALERRNPS